LTDELSEGFCELRGVLFRPWYGPGSSQRDDPTHGKLRWRIEVGLGALRRAAPHSSGATKGWMRCVGVKRMSRRCVPALVRAGVIAAR